MDNLERVLVASYEQAFLADHDGLIQMMLQQFRNPYLCFQEI